MKVRKVSWLWWGGGGGGGLFDYSVTPGPFFSKFDTESVNMKVRKVCWWGGVVACLIIVSLQVLSFENLTLNQSI